MEKQKLGAVLLDYAERGFHLFPIIRRTKKPAIKNNLSEASIDIEQILIWIDRFPNCNWGVSLAKSGLVAVDVDQKGLDKWGALILNHGEPETLKANSGSGVGMHYVFKAKPGTRYRGKITDGIDVKHNGYIAVFPSVHPKTKALYKWANKLSPQDAPDWITKLIEKPPLEQKKSAGLKFGNTFYSKIVEQLKEKDFGYDEWVRIGMALHAAHGGSDQGLELYLDLTQGKNFKEGDLEKARDKWNSFKADSSGVGGGTFVYLARNMGCDIPNPELDQDKARFLEAQREEQEKEAEENPQWFKDDEGRNVTVHPEFLVKHFNDDGYAVLTGESEGTVVRTYEDAAGLLQVKTLNFDRFRTALANYFLKQYVKTDSGKIKARLVNASDVWLRSAARKEYADIVFSPKPSPESLNLWSPIPCARVEGNVDKALWFIREIICAGDEARTEYVLQYLAHLVQKPEEKPSVVLVLIGTEGTGKGLFTEGFLKEILKTYYIMLSRPGILKDKFNKEQARKLVTVLDEAAWRGDHELVDLMKNLTGNASIMVEEKFGGRFSIDSYTRYIVTSNNEDAVKVPPNNRRYLVLNVSDKYLKSKVYGELWDDLRKGDLAGRFYNYLMNIDLSSFNAFEFPENLDSGGDVTKLKSLGAIGNFWWDAFVENPLELFFTQGEELQMSKKEVFAHFQEYIKTSRSWERGIDSRVFWRETKLLVPTLRETRVGSDGNRDRVMRIKPYDFLKEFCFRTRINFPSDFDDLEMLKTLDVNK